MIKIAFATMFLAAVVPQSCNKTPSALRESCTVMKEILYPDGQFMFNAEERKALRRVNKEKLANLIQYYQAKCPK